MRLFDIEDRTALPPQPAVRVNGKEISAAMIAREIQNHPAESPMAARASAARALVVRELLLDEARRRGLAGNPRELGSGQRETEADALVRELLDEAFDLPAPTEAECRRYYANNMTRFRSPTIWEPSHILVSADTGNGEARRLAEHLASEIIAILASQPHRFEELARSHSACPSSEHGGNLGQISSGQTTPAFEVALEDMAPGTITTEPVETPYGFHVIRVDRRIDGATLPFEAVHDKIADYLADAVFRRAVHQFVALLAGQASIEGIEIECAASPLIQ
ncbi:MAG: peptidylprolyl isomerase [Alphaproteobacteria bacterium]|nr:peptidylprolyl isomerase [Alphaproteobacteria bacterium]